MKRKFAQKIPKILFIALPILLIVGAVAAFTLIRNDKPSSSAGTSSRPGGDSSINYSPPTEEEKRQADEHKDELVNQGDGQPANSDGQRRVTVVITNDQNLTGPNVTVAGFVQGVVEDGGTCTAVLTKGAEKKTVTSEGFANVSTTNCPPIKVQLAAGNWQLVLSYGSSTSSGSSTKNITVN